MAKKFGPKIFIIGTSWLEALTFRESDRFSTRRCFIHERNSPFIPEGPLRVVQRFRRCVFTVSSLKPFFSPSLPEKHGKRTLQKYGLRDP